MKKNRRNESNPSRMVRETVRTMLTVLAVATVGLGYIAAVTAAFVCISPLAGLGVSTLGSAIIATVANCTGEDD